MGDIGPARQHYEVLPIPAVGIADADRWSVPVRLTVPSPQPLPVPHPEPTPEPIPGPGPEPAPQPGPDPAPVPSEHPDRTESR